MSETNRKIEILYRIIIAANRAVDMASLLESILDSTLEVVEFDAGGIYLLDKKSGTLKLHIHRGLPDRLVSEVQEYRMDDSLVRDLLTGEKPLFIEDVVEFKPEWAKTYGIGAIAALPLVYGERAIGSLNLSCKTPRRFSPEERDILQAVGGETGAAVARMQAETALYESERRHKELADSLPESVYEIDLMGNLLFANATAYRVFGYPPNALEKGLNVFTMVDPRDLERAAVDFGRMLAGEKIGPVEYLIKRNDGSVFPAVLHSVPTIRDEKLVGFRGVLVDASIINRTKEALRDSEEKFRAMAETTASGIFIWKKGRFVYANPAMEMITGYSLSEILSMEDFERLIHPDFLSFTRDRFARRPAAEGAPPRHEFKIRTREGNDVWIDLSFSTITYAKMPAVIGTFFDISDRKRAEEELARSQRLESLGVLAGGLAHDFNNILTVITGNISLARIQIADGGAADRLLKEAEMASFKARDLTQQLLTFSRGGAPIKKVTSIDELLVETVRFTLSGSNIRPEFEIDKGLWPAEVDPGQIGQVFNNLAINAQQAMPAGGTLSIRARNRLISGNDSTAPLGPGKYLEIEIEDRGIGIPAELLSRIFDPYFTTKQRGSGLGLTISYSIINRHGGHIEVRSTAGHGSVFTLLLPATDESPQKTEPARKSSHRYNGRVLIMDDDESVLEVGLRMLTTLGYAVETATDGNQAVMLYESSLNTGERYDAVILDLTIPGGPGGLDTLRKLAAMDADIRAVVSSGYSNDPVMSDFQAHGFAGVVAKPYNIEEMASVLEAVIGPERDAALKGAP